MPVATAQQYNLLDYSFSDFLLDDNDTLKATLRMFMDLNLNDAFHIEYKVRIVMTRGLGHFLLLIHMNNIHICKIVCVRPAGLSYVTNQ